MITQYNKTLIAQYLEIMASQDRQINELKVENKKLRNLHQGAKDRARTYKDSAKQFKEIAETWKKAHKDLTAEFNEYNYRLEHLMSQPTDKIAECINKYKENM